LTDPDLSRVGLAEPGGPVGPAGRLGQQARWAKQALANCFKTKFQILKFKCHFLFELKPNSKIQITFIKHFLNL
jgi:hypothetical protein